MDTSNSNTHNPNNYLAAYPELVRETSRIRRASVTHLSALVTEAQETLVGKLCKVYLAADAAAAQEILVTIIGENNKIARTHSNTLNEINCDEILAAHGKTVYHTCLEEIVRLEAGLDKEFHPVFPTLNPSQDTIISALQAFTKKDSTDPQELAEAASAQIKKEIIAADFGLTGAGSIVAENGVIVLAENQGDVRAVSNLPYRHIVIAGIDKIIESAEDAISLLQAYYICSTNSIAPAYVSLIGGPSRTADIEFKMAYGMHGPKEVHVILLDNGRSKLAATPAGALLTCTECGNCYDFCRMLAAKNDWSNTTLTPKALALALMRGELSGKADPSDLPDITCNLGFTKDDIINRLNSID